MPNAYWLSRETFAWNLEAPSDDLQVRLYHSADASMFVTGDGVIGGEAYDLTFRREGVGRSERERFPHLATLPCWTTFLRIDHARQLTRGQLAIAAFRNGELVEVASLQMAGALDQLFPYDGPLGVELTEQTTTLRLWAPTALDVRLLLVADGMTPDDAVTTETFAPMPMQLDSASGVWSATHDRAAIGGYYLYEVTVYVPNTGSIEINRVTDPYSTSLARNSVMSQIVDLRAGDLTPATWLQSNKPPLRRFGDVVLYELHVRDFSALDESVPPQLRARYGAFSVESDGTRHLRRIADAGVTHLHLLPINDFASAEDDERAYNWGYDPLHWMTPEGSYAVDPDGAARTGEVRSMVAAINQLGLRVVLDVVFNHTFAAGQEPYSLLDRIVPGYYHRLDEDGVIANSTCCFNTASEHAMMEKLMVDTLLHWAREYRVDGFRFDLMGHHLKRNMLRARDALRALTLEHDGVDGASLLFYGEGWDFGEMAGNHRGENASQVNLVGSGIATFNDRLRDALRGGNPFGELTARGFVTGLYDHPDSAGLREQFVVAIGMAGALRDFTVDVSGEAWSGARDAIGYAIDPLDVVSYVSAHDNETLWDIIQLKAPDSWSIDDRLRMNNLALSVIALGQGIPFFHAGDELLRSKSCERNSFVAGDLVNRLDFSLKSNHWGTALPPLRENAALFPHIERLLSSRETWAAPQHIARAAEHLIEMLTIRRSSPLFALQEGSAVRRVATFDLQHSGVVTMRLRDEREEIIVVLNARPSPFELHFGQAVGDKRLHPALAASSDPIVRTARLSGGELLVPARTAAVFI